MKEKIQSLLKELWAKDDGTTIREHTDKLLENLQKLKDYYEKRNRGTYPKGTTY
jgi:CRISPR-associated endonuclease/helicase Cas3